MENLHSFRFPLSLSLWIKSKGDYLSIIYIVITILWIVWIKPHFQRDVFKKVMKSYWLNQSLAINYLITEKVGQTKISFICQNLDHSTTGKLRMNDFSPTNLSLEISIWRITPGVLPPRYCSPKDHPLCIPFSGSHSI